MAVWADPAETLKARLEKDDRVGRVLTGKDLEDIFKIEPYLEKVGLIYKRLGLE